MGFEGSSLWKVRQKVGTDLLLWPGSTVLLERPDGHVLLGLRGDAGGWAMPGGGAEAGSSFADTAVSEVREEVDLTVSASDLIAFASISSQEDHLVRYPGGDLTHYFGLWFVARRWIGEPKPDGDEFTRIDWFDPSALPSPLFHSTEVAFDLYARYLAGGVFQVG